MALHTASVTVDQGILAFKFPYNLDLLADMKAAVPASDRAWDGTRKLWCIDPAHGLTVAGLIQRHCGITVSVPPVTTVVQPELRLLDLRYIGQAKARDGGDPTAFGWVNGSWSVIFPEPVLRKWFLAPARPDEAPTLYQVLSVAQTATAEEIKKAYRRLARSWHPDICREPDAAEQFKRINHAYQTLADPNTRIRYDVGLAFETLAKAAPHDQQALPYQAGYRAPLRCGYVLCNGTPRLSRFLVTEILAWEDVVLPDGRILSTTWPVGATTFTENWIVP
jgi:hypothetical protein